MVFIFNWRDSVVIKFSVEHGARDCIRKFNAAIYQAVEESMSSLIWRIHVDVIIQSIKCQLTFHNEDIPALIVVSVAECLDEHLSPELKPC